MEAKVMQILKNKTLTINQVYDVYAKRNRTSKWAKNDIRDTVKKLASSGKLTQSWNDYGDVFYTLN